MIEGLIDWFQCNHKAIVVNTVWYGNKFLHVDVWETEQR